MHGSVMESTCFYAVLTRSGISCRSLPLLKWGGLPMELVKNETIAGMIKDLRKRMGISQRAVASLLGLSRSTYAYKENSKVNLSIEDLQKLAATFGFSPELFFQPELLKNPGSQISAKPKARAELSSITDLKPAERELISSIRLYDAIFEKEQLLRKIQDYVSEELLRFYGEKDKISK